jgi:hypothetical protein
MRLKTILLLATHGMCIGVILFLLGFIVLKKMNNKDRDVLIKAKFSIEKSDKQMHIIKEEQWKQTKVQSERYPNDKNIDWYQKAKMISTKTDSMLVLVDSLQNHFSLELLYNLQGQANVFKNQAWETVLFDTSMLNCFPSFVPSDWLFQSWTQDAPYKFATNLSALKADIWSIGTATLGYCQKKTGSDDLICCAGYEPVISKSIINPSVGEQISYDLLLSYYGCNARHFTYRLNGKELPQKDGKANFKVKYDKPGQYPLRFEVEERIQQLDSVQVILGEKTYYLNVR